MAGLALATTGCPDGGEPADSGAADSGATDSGAATEPETSASTTMPSGETDPDPTTGGEVEPWLEAGWGISEFNPFEGTFPVVVGPQGLAMFSMPLRGAGFYSPPDPSFDNPDMPILQAWVDVPGYAITPDGHFNEVVDYPALFYPSLDEPGVLAGPAVWLVIPDQAEPEEIAGLDAHLHVEMLDVEGVLLEIDHDLVIGEPPEAPPGP